MSILEKIGCAPQTLNDRVKTAGVDSGKRLGVSCKMAKKIKALKRELRYDRNIVGWLVSNSAHAGFVLNDLGWAVDDRRPAIGMRLVHYSDRGSNTCLFATLSAWRRPVSSRLWVASPTAPTTP